MSAATLLLVRHARTTDERSNGATRLMGWHDPDLSQSGIEDAHRLARWVQDQPIAAVYTSTLKRAAQTAAPLAAALGLQPTPAPDLREICCGDLDGLLIDEVRRRFPDLWQRNLDQSHEDFRWPRGESYRDFRQRVLRCVRSIAARHAGERVVLITHAGCISQVLGVLYGSSAARWEDWRPRHASVTEVRWQHDWGALVRFDWLPLATPDDVRTPQHA